FFLFILRPPLRSTLSPYTTLFRSAVEPLRDLVPIVRTHHERYDGKGYPDGLNAAQIPIESQIVAAADAFEVIVSRRAYKQAQTVDRKSTRLNSSHVSISYAVFCLK